MLKWSVPLAALTLAGCGRPDVKACEIFIKDGLRSPSTYRLISMSEQDEKVSKPPLPKEAGELERMAWEQDKAQHGIRSLILEYDAANAYGTPIRGHQVCTFATIDGDLQDNATIDANTAHRRAMEAFDAAARSGALPNVKPEDWPTRERTCC